MDEILKISDPLPDGCISVYTINRILTKKIHPIYTIGLSVLPGKLVHRIQNIRNIHDAHRSCCGELLCRLGISESFAIPWDTIKINKNIHGKPLYAGQHGIWFSVTHSGDWVGCAVSHEPVGLDIERIRSVHPSLPRRVLSPSEYEYFNAYPDIQQSSVFIRQWCLKESYLKARGSGLATPWRAVSIRFKHEEALLESPLMPFPVRFQELDIGSEYRGALCAFGNRKTIRKRHYSPEKFELKLKHLIASR